VRVGLYARVSTHDQQTLPLQLAAMRDYVAKRGWKTAVEIQEVGSGAISRPKREELLKAARRRELDRIVVWRLDRWGKSLLDLIATLQELASLAVGFVSLSEALDLTTPSSRALTGCSRSLLNSNEIFSATGLKPGSLRRARKAGRTGARRVSRSTPRRSGRLPEKDSTKALFHAACALAEPPCADFSPDPYRVAVESSLACKITRICLAP
jgi:putative DNA-invertase from lambdoid prophage Rac